MLEMLEIVETVLDAASDLQLGESDLQLGESDLQFGESDLQLGESDLQFGDFHIVPVDPDFYESMRLPEWFMWVLTVTTIGGLGVLYWLDVTDRI